MTQPTFSGNVLNFVLPTAWEQLSQEELKYVLFALTHLGNVEARTYIFIRLTGIKVVRHQGDGWECDVWTNRGIRIRFFLKTWQIDSFSRRLEFVRIPPESPVFLHTVGEFHAVDGRLHGVPFKDYLNMDNCYQGYLQTKEEKYLNTIASLLYCNECGRHPHTDSITPEVRLSSFLWLNSVKQLFLRQFPHLFRPAGNESAEPVDMLAVMNAQIRALTGGDVTKEKEVLSMDCWRTLTELNEKAREQKEFNQRYGRN